jgi:hypothetical protein
MARTRSINRLLDPGAVLPRKDVLALPIQAPSEWSGCADSSCRCTSAGTVAMTTMIVNGARPDNRRPATIASQPREVHLTLSIGRLGREIP